MSLLLMKRVTGSEYLLFMIERHIAKLRMSLLLMKRVTGSKYLLVMVE